MIHTIRCGFSALFARENSFTSDSPVFSMEFERVWMKVFAT